MKSYRTLNIILITTCLLMDMCIYVVYRYYDKPNGLYQVAINNLKPIDPLIPENLPYSEYRKIKVKQKEDRILKNGDHTRFFNNLVSVLGVGTSDILCDTCKIKGPSDLRPETRYHYLSLRGWKLKSTRSIEPELDSVIFHVENGQSYIRKNVIETDNSSGMKVYKVEAKDIPVKFKYSHKLQMLKIPVSQQTVHTLKTIFTTFNILICLYGAFNFILLMQLIDGLIGGPLYLQNKWWTFPIYLFAPILFVFIIIKLLSPLRRKEDLKIWSADKYAFTTYNIFRIRILAYSFIGVSIFFLLLNLVMRLVFNSYFTDDVILNTEHLFTWWITLHVGILFLLILNVFMQGKALKDEQDLTV